MEILSKMGTDTKMVGGIALAATVGYFISRHFDKKAQEEVLDQNPDGVEHVKAEVVVDPVNP